MKEKLAREMLEDWPAPPLCQREKEKTTLGGCHLQKGLEVGRLPNVGQRGPLQDWVEVGEEPWP